jgi:alkanesulfonate monooxygenase SsuD/methylene tetrahydromethanopterin reductase-like flavin-dependent oxidoreductase (luciferase family)
MGLDCPPVRHRQGGLEEVLQIVPALLRGDTVTYAGKFFRVHGARLPLPAVQQPHVPILVAGGGPRTTLRFVAQYADTCNICAASWAGGGFSTDDNRTKLEILRRRCAELGRDGESVLRTCIAGIFFLGETQEAARGKLAKLPSWVIAGAQGLPGLKGLAFAGTPDGAVTRLLWVVDVGFQYLV